MPNHYDDKDTTVVTFPEPWNSKNMKKKPMAWGIDPYPDDGEFGEMCRAMQLATNPDA